VTTARRVRTHSYAQYLKVLEVSHIKLEFIEGEIYAMASGTPAHAQLAAQAIVLLKQSLGKACAVFTSDLKILIERADLATFPDAAVVCGPQASADKDANALTNPSVLVEVTSPSTEFYDRGEKLKMYQQLPSLKVVLLVSHRAQRVTLVRRTASGWDELDYRGGEVVACTEPNFQFSVDDLYEGVALEA
jgi:Uma2 family endonuclease